MRDDEDQQVDQLDGHETQEINNLDSSQLDHIQLTTWTAVMLRKSTIQPLLDEFLSAVDDETVMIQPETRLITLTDLLERTFNLLKRCRQLVRDIRNIGVVQAFTSMEVGKKGRGLTLDMEVSFL